MSRGFVLLLLGGGAAFGLWRLFSTVEDAQKEVEGRPQYWPLVVDAANAANVPPAILAGIVKAESSWSNEPNRHSEKCGVNCIASRVCAIGLAQVLPSTAADMGITSDLCIPANNLLAAARYLRRLFTKYNDWHTAAVAYNWGPGNVDRALVAGDSFYSGSIAYADKVVRAAESYGLSGDCNRPTLFRIV